jgi:hypothetical protein
LAMSSILPDGRPSVGRGLPPPLMWELPAAVKLA